MINRNYVINENIHEELLKISDEELERRGFYIINTLGSTIEADVRQSSFLLLGYDKGGGATLLIERYSHKYRQQDLIIKAIEKENLLKAKKSLEELTKIKID